MKVRVRFAPSPTGFLHIGGLRTALYNYALAHKYNGQFILRIEDTDQSRYSEQAVEEIYAAMDEYGITPDESDRHGGKFGPYTQSERLDLYKKYAEELVSKGHAYYDFLTPEETNEIKEKNKLTNAVFRSPHRNMSDAEVKQNLADGKPYVIRQKLPLDRVVNYKDGVQGDMEFNTMNVDDTVLLKSDGFPTYHLAMVVDDHLMEITHVFRGAEWGSSIPRHVLLFEAFGWEMPQLYHLSAILDPDGGKLSKRKGATNAREFLWEGYLPEAVLNFLMLLGWSDPSPREYGQTEREFYSLQDFVQLFEPEDLNKSNPVFNVEKLEWFNAKYIANMPTIVLLGRFIDWMQNYSTKHYDAELIEALKLDSTLEDKLDLIKEKTKTLKEIPEQLKFFYERPTAIDWSIKQLQNLDGKLPQVRQAIADFLTTLPEESADWDHDVWESGMRAIADQFGIKHGDAFMVLRVALVGTPFSPELFRITQLMDKAEILARVNA